MYGNSTVTACSGNRLTKISFIVLFNWGTLTIETEGRDGIYMYRKSFDLAIIKDTNSHSWVLPALFILYNKELDVNRLSLWFCFIMLLRFIFNISSVRCT